MDLYGKKSKSVPQKLIIHLLEILLLWLSYRILFQEGGAWVENFLHIDNAGVQKGRRMIIFIFNIVVFLRLGFMMIVLLQRRIPWEESFSVPLAFAVYYVGFSILVLPTQKAVDGLDIFAIVLFIFGSVLNTGGELLRHRWKRLPENKGKLYTGGFFKYSRHINYFGDLLWVTAYAVITRNWYAGIIPVLLFCLFAFYNAPKLDHYLKVKYGAQYDSYAENARMLIPFLY
ncbi:methyltransferase family protein [Niabella insulamsoli]|uniref:methyltransferase family protein n=1 Tax=Niabella insulamsoli TaxID=3144874 RepID=UPI0031FC3AE7